MKLHVSKIRKYLAEENVVILIVQVFQVSEAAELRWDGATEMINGQQPDRARMKGGENTAIE